MTAEGLGTFYPGKAEAIRAVQVLQARGVASIDVGCMQVNLLHHPAAFRDLDEAFDPAANALYAARFLGGLYARTGTWPAAAAAYHSLTPKLGAQYGQYARSAADQVQGLSTAVRDKDIDELLDDARAIVRKSPAVAISAAAALGFIVARLVQSGLDANATTGGSTGSGQNRA